MGFLRKWREKKKYYDRIKEAVIIIEQVEKVAIQLESPQRREYIGRWIEDYNKKNKYPIPEDIALKLYDMGYNKIQGLKNGDTKREFVECVISEVKRVAIKYLPYLIDLAVKVLINKVK